LETPPRALRDLRLRRQHALIQAVLLDIKARREERWLREKFPDYDEYAVKVRRLIPWLYCRNFRASSLGDDLIK
jgi:hypothetical protein